MDFCCKASMDYLCTCNYRIAGYFRIKNFAQVFKHQFRRFFIFEVGIFRSIAVQLFVRDDIS